MEFETIVSQFMGLLDNMLILDRLQYRDCMRAIFNNELLKKRVATVAPNLFTLLAKQRQSFHISLSELLGIKHQDSWNELKNINETSIRLLCAQRESYIQVTDELEKNRLLLFTDLMHWHNINLKNKERGIVR